MRLAVIDARVNPIASNRRVGSDPLPDGAYEQYVIDVEPWLKAVTITEDPRQGLPPTQLLIIDCTKLPAQNRIVPAWVAVVKDNGDMWPSPGVLELPDRVVASPVKPHLQLWCKAGLTLAKSQFDKALQEDYEEARALIAYWLMGGSRKDRGMVAYKLDGDDLPMRILQCWHQWQSPTFKSKKLTLWGARLDSIQKAGYREALDQNRLKVTYQRMGFQIPKSELQKRKKL